jgi:hypothetical protein
MTLEMVQGHVQRVTLTAKHAQDPHLHNVRVARRQGRCLATEDVFPPVTEDNISTPQAIRVNNVIHLVPAVQGRQTINVCHAVRSKSCVAEHVFLPRAADQRG